MERPGEVRVRRDEAAACDRRDPLAAVRDGFALPAGVVYLDGNSLGPLAHAVVERVARTTTEEWGTGLIRSWNAAGWVDLSERVGARLAPLIGATAEEIVVTDSTSVDLFKLLVAACRLRPGRRRILIDADDFPTDRYVADAVARLLDREVVAVPRDRLLDALDATVAVVSLTHVDYRTGARHDAPAVTARAHAAGALGLWDLSHSAGALAVDLAAWGADLAVGCTYKYLNGGPGAPAYAYVAGRHHDGLDGPVHGWFGHAEPFAFGRDWAPAAGAARLRSGTPPVLSLAALDAALELWEGIDPAAVARKAADLTERFIALVDARCPDLEVVTPRDPAARGAQVSLRHPEAYPLMQALIARGVIGDHRPPDLLRFGFSPLVVRHVDVWDAVDVLADLLATGAWRDERFRRRHTVI